MSLSYGEQSTMSSSLIEEETIVFDSSSSALHESAPANTLWPSDAEEEDEEEEKVIDCNMTPSTTSPPSSSSVPTMSYYQNLAFKLRQRSGGRRSISIISDNPFSHSVNGLPLLPPLYEYSAMDEFLPSLLKEKGLIRSSGEALSIVSDNASSGIPEDVQCDYSELAHQPMDEGVALDIIVEHPFGSSSSSEDATMVVDEAIQEMDRNARVGRSSSYNAIYSTPTPKPKRVVTRARSFQGNNLINKGVLSPLSTKSPQSVLDIFNTADAAELRSSFNTL